MPVDDTIGGDAADSYVSVPDFRAWVPRYKPGETLTTEQAADDVVAAYLRSATVYLDGRYTWIGVRAHNTQALSWPRERWGYEDLIPESGLPEAIRRAQMEFAYIAWKQGLDTLFRSADKGRIVSESKNLAGVLQQAVTYATTDAEARRSGAAYGEVSYPAIDRMLERYTLDDGGMGEITLYRG